MKNMDSTKEKLFDALSPDQKMKLENEFGDLFVYERDGSIGYGLEIISSPMTKGYYEKISISLKTC